MDGNSWVNDTASSRRGDHTGVQRPIVAQTNVNPASDKLSPEDIRYAIAQKDMAFLTKGNTTLAIDKLLNQMVVARSNRHQSEQTLNDQDHGTRDIPKPKFAVAHVNLNMTISSQGTESDASIWSQQLQQPNQLPDYNPKTGANPQVPSSASRGNPLSDLKKHKNMSDLNIEEPTQFQQMRLINPQVEEVDHGIVIEDLDSDCKQRHQHDYLQLHQVPLRCFAGPGGYSPSQQHDSQPSARPKVKSLDSMTDEGAELPIGLIDEVQVGDRGAQDANHSMRNLIEEAVPRPFSSNSDVPSKKTRSLDSQRPIPINIQGINKKLAHSENPKHQNFFTSITPLRRMQTMFDLRDYERKKTLHLESIVEQINQREEAVFSSVFEHKVVWAIVLGFHLLTMIIFAVSLVLDLTYLYRSTFASEELYILYLLLQVSRLIAPALLVAIQHIRLSETQPDRGDDAKKVDIKAANESQQLEEGEQVSDKSYERQGLLLYSALALGQFTGSHRLFNFKNFYKHIKNGLVFDLLISAISTFVILVVNNSMLSAAQTEAGFSPRYTSLQSNAVIIKFVLMLLLVLETIFFAVEMFLLNKFKRQAAQQTKMKQKTSLDESSKRARYAKVYSIGTLGWLLVCTILFTLFMVLLEEASCRAGQVVQWDQICLFCEDTNCADCSETGIDRCAVCKPGYYSDLETQKCLIDDCQVSRCQSCQPQAPQACDTCEDGFELTKELKCKSSTCEVEMCEDCQLSGEAACDKCFSGYSFNRMTVLCEDVTCKKSDCLKCDLSGTTDGCDVCDFGFFYDQEAQECTEVQEGCKVSECVKCDNRDNCEQCKLGYWLDTTQNECLESACQQKKCEDCSLAGPLSCDRCEIGHYLKDGVCTDCDADPEATLCETCSSEGVCETCAEGLWYDKATNTCLDSACVDSLCLDCSVSGPNSCDVCKPGHYFNSGSCLDCDSDPEQIICEQCTSDGVCQVCAQSLWLDSATNTCVDGTCLDKCKDCSISGPSGCDIPDSGYRFSDGIMKDCDSDLWKVLCKSCTSDGVCEKCASGYWLDITRNECLESACQQKKCEDCSLAGPLSCDRCEFGYYLKDGVCTDCDADPEATLCETCSSEGVCETCAEGLWYEQATNTCLDSACVDSLCLDCSVLGPKQCTQCPRGYRIQDGKCLKCDPLTCTSCDLETGICPECNIGFFKTEQGECATCSKGCPLCTSSDFCVQCDNNMHTTMYPESGQCQCDTYRGWKSLDGQSNNCSCTLEFLTESGQCTSCEKMFPGCSECNLVSEKFTRSAIQVVANPSMPSTEPGTYVCTQCSDPSTFYNVDLGYCVRCENAVSGCDTCANGKCTECAAEFALMENGGCFDCSWHSKGCAACTEQECTACKDGYTQKFGFVGIQTCVIDTKPF